MKPEVRLQLERNIFLNLETIIFSNKFIEFCEQNTHTSSMGWDVQQIMQIIFTHSANGP